MIGRKPRTTPELPSEAPAIGTQITVDGLRWAVRPLDPNVVIISNGKETGRAVIIDATTRTVLIAFNAGWQDLGRAFECVELICRSGQTHDENPINIGGDSDASNL